MRTPNPSGEEESSDDEGSYYEDEDETRPVTLSPEAIEEQRSKAAEAQRQAELDRKATLLMKNFKTANKLPDPAVFEQFRVDMLSDITRLMAVQSGREILNLVNTIAGAKGQRVDFLPGSTAQCWSNNSSSAKGHSMGTGPMPIKLRPGSGSSFWVELPVGQRDGDKLAADRNGNPMVAPTPVLLGHELLHGLHDLTGTSRSGVFEDRMEEAGLDPAVWSNFEEYWTIKAGEISEETIRRDYGLSAERFGHGAVKADPALIDVALALADKTRQVEGKGREGLVAAMKARGFAEGTVAMMTDATLFDLDAKPDIKGPLPAGWNPACLDAATIGAIVIDQLPHVLNRLGWTPFGLPYDGAVPDSALGFPLAIKPITRCEVHHPTTPKGRQFKALGGMAALEKLAKLRAAKGIDLGVASTTSWPENLATLLSADREIDKHLPQKAESQHSDAAPPRRPLIARIDTLLKAK